VLATALARRRVRVAHPVWDDPSVDWSRFAIAVVRSTWDYHRQRARFVRWALRAGKAVDLWNRPEVVRWNTDKRYLLALQRAGVPVVPTLWSRSGRTLDLAHAMDSRGWGTVVVKPAVSAAGDRTRRIRRSEARGGQLHLSEIPGTAMVQPYRAGVETVGERSLVFLGGRHSHTVRRVPLFRRKGPRPRESLAPTTGEMRRIATQALAACPRDLLYARVDLLPDPLDGWQVLEVELTEPSLFFVPYPRAADTMAAQIVARLRR
jgi:hypothetical protein